MKRFYLLPLLFLFATFTFAQRKTEFGFVVKAGTFTLPHEKKEGISRTYEYPAGFSSSYGLFVSRRLGGHFRLSLDMQYNFSRYKQVISGVNYLSSFSSGGTFRTTRSISASSFIMPLQVHFLPKKDGKLSLNMGAALNVVAGSEMYMVYETSPQNATIEQRGPQVRRFQALFVAGTHYKIRQATSLGLEFTGVLRRNQPFSWLAPTFLSSVCDCIVNGNPFWMQSLAISLRHNILR